jgi:hypothetical protein
VNVSAVPPGVTRRSDRIAEQIPRRSMGNAGVADVDHGQRARARERAARHRERGAVPLQRGRNVTGQLLSAGGINASL